MKVAIAGKTIARPLAAVPSFGQSAVFDRRPGVLRALAPVALLITWLITSSAGLLSERVLPAPSAIYRAGLEVYRSGELISALLVSGQRLMIGFMLGSAIAVVLGVLAATSRLGENVVDPPMQMMRTLPLFGLIPLFIIWFGIDEQPKVFLIALGVAFPLYLNTYAGIRQVDVKLLDLSKVLRLTRWECLRDIMIPGALPQALVGLRQSLGVAWLSLIVAEQVNASAGLGYIVNNAREFLRTDIVIFGLLAYGAFGLLTDWIVRVLERHALRWSRP